MATATIVCGSCGAPLSRVDNFCPQCGTGLSWLDQQASSSRRCDVCGHLNRGEARTCESCGAKLPSGTPGGTEEPALPPRGEVRRGSRKEARKQPAQGAARRFEPWQIISFVALVGLVAFLIYNETSKPPSSIRSNGPVNVPAGAPLPQALADLEPLQRAVDANPTDPAALIRLANALHDNHAYVRAADVYKKYLVLRPRNPNARVDLGICYYELSSLDTANTVQYLMMALAEMQRAHADSVTHQPAVFNLGVVNLRLGNLEESNKWFRDAVQLNRTSELGVRAQQMLEQHTFSQQ